MKPKNKYNGNHEAKKKHTEALCGLPECAAILAAARKGADD